MLGDVLAVVMESKRNRRALCRVDVQQYQVRDRILQQKENK
jgi:hypothetical protein